MVYIYCLLALFFSFASIEINAFDTKFILEKDLEGEDEVQNILHGLLMKASEVHSKQLLSHDNVLTDRYIPSPDKFLKNNSVNGCACVNKNCGCCAHIEVKKIDLNETVCANVSYLPAKYGISVTVTLGRFTLINETISASDPPPICEEIPYLKKYASICLRFHDLHVGNSTFKGCIKIEVRLVEVIEKSVELGCFTIPYKDTIKKVQSNNLSIQRYSTPRRKEDEKLYFKRHSTV